MTRAWKAIRLIAALALTLLVASGPPLTAACGDSSGSGSTCCRVCTTGKACGNSCIAQTSTCSQPAGCACNG